MRPTSACVGVMAAFLFVCSAFAPALAGAPSRVWLTLGQDAATQMTVSFALDELRTDLTVEYGKNAPGEHTAPVSVRETMGNPIGYAYHTYLENLSPATTYHYRVRVGDQVSETYQFTTGPTDPCAPVQFIAMGDSRSQLGGSAFGSNYLSDAAATGAAFMVNTGDLVKEGKNLDEWAHYLLDTSNVSPYVPLMPVIGNHDDGPNSGNEQHLTKLVHTPANGIGELRSHYYFEYGNALFVALTNHDSQATAQQQAQWLDELLESSNAAWKIVFIHEPFFTCPGFFGLMGHKPDERKVGQYFLPVFAKHNVDMVFTGHNHMYELFSPHDGNGFVNDPARGTVHVTTGGAAEAAAVAMLIEPALTCQGRVAQSDQIHFLVVRIIGGDLVLEYYARGRLGNAPKDAEFHFGIRKNLGLDCSLPPTDGDLPDGDLPDGDDEEPEPIDGDDGEDPEDGDDEEPDDPDAPVICDPGAIACEENSVVKCNRVGTRWVELEDCGDKVCRTDRCVVPGDEPVDGDLPPADGDTAPEPDPGPHAGTEGGGCRTGEGFWLVTLGLLALLGVSRRRKEFFGA